MSKLAHNYLIGNALKLTFSNLEFEIIHQGLKSRTVALEGTPRLGGIEGSFTTGRRRV